MTTRVTVPNARRIWLPRICKFPNLPRSGGFEFNGWEWYEMKELHNSLMDILGAQGYDGDKDDLKGQRNLPDYNSFRPEYLNVSPALPFTAVRFRQKGETSELEIDYAPDFGTFDFFGEDLHVPAVWGTMVIAVVRFGVVHVEKTAWHSFRTMRWDGSIAERGTNLRELFVNP